LQGRLTSSRVKSRVTPISEIVLRYARDAAEAELELERIRKVKVALVERVLVFGALGPTVRFGPVTKALRHLKLVIAGKAMLGEPIDPLATLPSEEPERSAEAMRRAVPDLIRLDRYEGRAVRRRDHAIKRTINNRLSKEIHLLIAEVPRVSGNEANFL
jgi:hypothetical protein